MSRRQWDDEWIEEIEDKWRFAQDEEEEEEWEEEEDDEEDW